MRGPERLKYERGLCHECFVRMKSRRKPKSPNEAFRFARDHRLVNVRGARRLAAWALSL